MTQHNAIKLFEEKRVRTVWDDQQEKWFFSVVDVVEILAGSKDPLTARKYWNKLKQGLKKENLRDNMPTRYESVGCDDCRFIGTKESALRQSKNWC